MAQFCTKCGSPLAEGIQFCTGCGATAGQPSAPPAQAQAPLAQPSAAAVARPAAIPGPGAKPASGSPVVKIVLIVLAVLMLLGLLGMGACVYFAYRAKQRFNQFQKQVTTSFPMPAGTREVHTQPTLPGSSSSQPSAPVIDMGISAYPGATPVGNGTTVTIGTGQLKVQEYTTSDSVDQVTAFYKGKLGSNAIVTQAGQNALLQLQGSNGYLNIAVAPDASSGKTKITIQSVSK